jgi:hypothetical protein
MPPCRRRASPGPSSAGVPRLSSARSESVAGVPSWSACLSCRRKRPRASAMDWIARILDRGISGLHQVAALRTSLADSQQGRSDISLATPAAHPRPGRAAPRASGSHPRPLGSRHVVHRKHLPDRSVSADRLVSVASHCVSKRPIWLGEAAQARAALPPTIQRIAGSWRSRSASFTSS